MVSQPKPSLSIRKYIKWGETFPTENTSTRVLTSPAPHHTFVDVRLLLVPLSTKPAPLCDLSDVDWALAGTTLHYPGDDGAPPREVFKHWIDSRYPDAESATDEGTFFRGAAPGEALERGEMLNPSTGRVESYEECWIDGLAKQPEGWAGWVLKWESTDDEGVTKRGMMGKVGNVVQGVLRIGEEIAVGRWENDTENTEEIQRKAIAEIGDVKKFYLGSWDGLKTGDKLVSEDGQEWTCVESW